MSEVPTSPDGLEEVQKQLNQPLIGVCTAKHPDSKGLAVFQVRHRISIASHVLLIGTSNVQGVS